MNYNTLVVLVIAVFSGIVVAAVLKEYRHAFPVPEGYVGLLYHKGKLLKILTAGRHVHWGRFYTLDAQDLRRTSLVIPGQDVLTADNLGLKLSLLLAYQVVD